jgi:hypothetical protein
MNDSLLEDYQRLALQPGATPLEVERAYAHLRALYAEGALACYGLFEQPQQQQCLEEIEAAYRRIVAVRRQLAPSPAHRGSADPAPAAGTTPGSLLLQARLQAGLTIKELANTLKIGHLHLQNIEQERYDALPATVYLRGFLLSYAKALHIPEPDTLVSSYLTRRLEQEQGSA